MTKWFDKMKFPCLSLKIPSQLVERRSWLHTPLQLHFIQSKGGECQIAYMIWGAFGGLMGIFKALIILKSYRDEDEVVEELALVNSTWSLILDINQWHLECNLWTWPNFELPINCWWWKWWKLSGPKSIALTGL